MTECQHRGRPPGLPYLLLVMLAPQVLSSEEDTFPDTSSPSLLLPHIQLEDDWQRYLLPPYAPPKVWKRYFIDITHFSRTETPAWSCLQTGGTLIQSSKLFPPLWTPPTLGCPSSPPQLPLQDHLLHLVEVFVPTVCQSRRTVQDQGT